MFVFLLLAFTATSIVAQQANDWSAPWQSTSVGNSGDRIFYQGKPPTIFAPGGKLYSVERMVEAASSLEDESSNLVVAISCREGLVVVSTIRQSPHLSIQPTSDLEKKSKDYDESLTQEPLWILKDDDNDQTSPSPFLRLSPVSSTSDYPLMAVCAGNAVDSQILQLKIQRLGGSALWDSIHSSHAATYNHHQFTQAGVLARQLADHLQVPTQTVGGKGGRMLASSALVLGGATVGANEFLPLWRVDPTGQFWSCHAAVIGRGCVQAEQTLLELTRAKINDPDDAGVRNYLQQLTMNEAKLLSCQVIRQTFEKSSTPYRWRTLFIARDRASQRQLLSPQYTFDQLESLATTPSSTSS